jgi:hypothetical protein
MSHARYRPPDYAKGDESTIGGYAAVHDRPAAFEGADGFSYSVELMAEETDDANAPWGGFVFFVRWARLGAQSPEGHLESDYLVHGSSEQDTIQKLGALPLAIIKSLLDELIGDTSGDSTRSWWDAMHDEGDAS